MRAEELVAGAGQEVAIQCAHIDEPMRSEMYGVDEGHRANLMRQAHDFGDIVDGADGIRSVSDRNQTSIAPNLRLQVKHIERAIGELDICGAHLRATLFQRYPRRDVGVVIELGDQQLIAAFQITTDGAAQGQGQRRHVGAEYDFVGVAVEEVGHGSMGAGINFIRTRAGEKRSMRVCV